MLLDELANGKHILRALDEGSSHEVHPLLTAKDDILLVLLGNRRQAKGDTGSGNALLRAHLAAVLDGRLDVLSIDGIHLQGNKAIGKEQGIPRLHLRIESLVVHRNMGLVPRLVGIGQGELVPLLQHDLAVLELAKAHFRPLGVKDQGNHLARLLCSLPHHIDTGKMFRMVAMGEIEPRAVHAVLNHGLDHSGLFRGRSLRANDFRFLQHINNLISFIQHFIHWFLFNKPAFILHAFPQ